MTAGAMALAASPARAQKAALVSSSLPDLPSPPKRILLGDGHLLLALSLVHDAPGDLVCAWQGDLVRHSKEIFATYQAAYPHLSTVPLVGQASPQTFSVEAALSSRPDVVLLGGCYGPGPEDETVVKRLEAAGIPVLFVDFYEDPIGNTAPSMRLIGKLLGGAAEEKAERFASWHETSVAAIRTRLAETAPNRPTVMLQANAGAPGWDCCWMPGTGGLGAFIELAGGDNIGARLGSLPWVQARREFVLTMDPQFVFVTGGGYLAGRGGLVIGPGVSSDAATASLEAVARSADTAPLTAFQQQRLSGIWHLLHATPFNIVAAQAIARRLHPELFGDMDPAATMAGINRDFLAVPLEGTYTVDLSA
ncbi:iron complex transport system substrate-binding protein [Neorhizobium huautlense]|uniref:Iron complex transport system substrate-binding protein n=1 Tax=Neorhizobium huautlense TaxID=67774 RepID=A0ABT9Q021_9HYPH|nr:ABC transporter substrate-binding protein [Neorhizobium huautlense]MDP9840076.1 iron complex transport system substrate-binding protein [Neorhizobium huautlense]